MRRFAVLAFLPLLQQCAPGPASKDDPGLDRTAFHLASDSPSPPLSTVKIPVLRSAALDRKWGKPQVTVLPDGGYHLEYTKPGRHFETLSIYATPGVINSDAPVPPDYRDIGLDRKTGQVTTLSYKQSWQTVVIAGRPTHVYIDSPGGGADPPVLSSVTFPRDEPGMPVASYRVTASSNEEDADKLMHGYMETVAFAANASP